MLWKPVPRTFVFTNFLEGKDPGVLFEKDRSQQSGMKNPLPNARRKEGKSHSGSAPSQRSPGGTARHRMFPIARISGQVFACALHRSHPGIVDQKIAAYPQQPGCIERIEEGVVECVPAVDEDEVKHLPLSSNSGKANSDRFSNSSKNANPACSRLVTPAPSHCVCWNGSIAICLRPGLD